MSTGQKVHEHVIENVDIGKKGKMDETAVSHCLLHWTKECQEITDGLTKYNLLHVTTFSTIQPEKVGHPVVGIFQGKIRHWNDDTVQYFNYNI